MTGERSERIRRRLEAASPWLLGLFGMVTTFRPVLASGFRSLQVYFGDPRLVNYVLEHTWRWVGGEALHSRFWSPPIFFPTPGTGAYTDTMLGAAPPYWVLRAGGLDGGLAMQVWMMLVFGLNFLAGHLLLRRSLSVRPLAAACGAFLIAFASSRLANFNSPQLFPIFFGLLALLALVRLVQGAGSPRARLAWQAVFFACLALQAWSTFYPTFFLVLILGVSLGAALALRGTRGRTVALLREGLAGWLAGGVLALLAVLPLALGHLHGAEEVGWRSYEQTYKNLPTLASWVFPGRTSLLYGELYGHGPFRFERTPSSQHANGFGVLTTVLCLYGFLLGRGRPWIRVVGVTTILLIVLATRWPGGFTAWRAVYELVPSAKAIRYPARLGQYLALPAALGLALLVQSLAEVARRRRWLAPLLVAVLVEQLHDVPAYPEAEFRRAVAAIADEVAPESEAFYVSKRSSARRNRRTDEAEGSEEGEGGADPPRLVHLVAMWAGLRAGKPTLNGFYGNTPPDWSLTHGEESQVLRWILDHGLDPARVEWLELSEEWHPRTHPEVSVSRHSLRRP